MREVSREGRGRLRRAGRAGAVAAALGLAAWAQAFGAAGPKDEALYGEARPEPHVRHVAAGPIRMKFQDGELRYLRVGQREIVRRIYFAVRDERWDTVMPRFTRLQVDAKADAFRIDLGAECRNDLVDYRWTGRIAGAADGTVTFRVEGEAGADFRSPRVGLCVLLGADALAGLDFETEDAAGKTARGRFPERVSPDLLAGEFRALRYATPEGAGVAFRLAATHFGMEDQRNYGDSSYKAYASMPYGRQVAKGEKAAQTLTLRVTGATAAAAPPAGPCRIRIGPAVAGAKVPALLAPAPDGKPRTAPFVEINQHRADHAGAETVSFAYNPASHLPDDDTFMENRPAAADQVRTVRAFAPKARVRVGPITLDSPYPRAGRDPRNRGLFAAAWAAGLVRHLALAGADEAVFCVGPGPVDEVLREMGVLKGRAVLQADAAAGDADAPPVEALAVRADGGGAVVWLSNSTDRAQAVVVEGLGGAAKAALWRLGADGPAASSVPVEGGRLALELGAFEVCRITAAGPD